MLASKNLIRWQFHRQEWKDAVKKKQQPKSKLSFQILDNFQAPFLAANADLNKIITK